MVVLYIHKYNFINALAENNTKDTMFVVAFFFLSLYKT